MWYLRGIVVFGMHRGITCEVDIAVGCVLHRYVKMFNLFANVVQNNTHIYNVAAIFVE